MENGDALLRPLGGKAKKKKEKKKKKKRYFRSSDICHCRITFFPGEHSKLVKKLQKAHMHTCELLKVFHHEFFVTLPKVE